MTDTETIEMIKNTIIGEFRSQNGTFHHKFLIQDLIPFDDYKIMIFKKSNKWSDTSITEIPNPENYTHILQTKLEIIADVKFSNNSSTKTFEDYIFDLNIKSYFQLPDGYFSYDFMDKNKKIFDDFVTMIEDTARTEGLDSFGSENKKIDGKNYISYFTSVTRKSRTNKIVINDFLVFDDISRAAQDIQHYLSLIISLKPHVTDFLSDPIQKDGKTFYRYFHTVYDKYYLMTSNILYEKFYNFWDKIGDLIALCFSLPIPAKRVFFSEVIKKMDSQHINSPNFIWLKNFHDKEYMKLNNERINVVHYTNLESTLTDGWHGHLSDSIKLQELNKKRIELVDYFKEQYELLFTGFEKTCKLIDEIE